MEYIKVPYVQLNGKKYGGDLSNSNQNDIQQIVASFVGDGASHVYDTTGNLTFQKLTKQYQSGKDPIKDTSANVSGIIQNPEKKIAIHKAISAVANKFGYDVPNEKDLENISLELYQLFTQSPNSYFVTTFTDRENILIITNENSSVIGILLPSDIDYMKFVTADKNSNLLIPKEAYDQDLEVM